MQPTEVWVLVKPPQALRWFFAVVGAVILGSALTVLLTCLFFTGWPSGQDGARAAVGLIVQIGFVALVMLLARPITSRPVVAPRVVFAARLLIAICALGAAFFVTLLHFSILYLK